MKKRGDYHSTEHPRKPDAADESHFTIEYERDGETGTVDGRLQNDDAVKLQIRDGPAKGLEWPRGDDLY